MINNLMLGLTAVVILLIFIILMTLTITYCIKIISSISPKKEVVKTSQLTPETKAMIEQANQDGVIPGAGTFVSSDKPRWAGDEPKPLVTNEQSSYPTRKVTLVPPSERREVPNRYLQTFQQRPMSEMFEHALPKQVQHVDVEQVYKEHDDNYSQVITKEQQEYLANQELAKQMQSKAAITRTPTVLPQTRTIQQQRQLITDFLAEKSQTLEADKTLASKYGTTVVTLEKYATDDQMDEWESIRAICMAKPRTPSKAQQAEMNNRQQQYSSHFVDNHSNVERKVVEK